MDHAVVFKRHQMNVFRADLKPGTLEPHSVFTEMFFHCYIERLAHDPVLDRRHRNELCEMSAFKTETKQVMGIKPQARLLQRPHL